MKEWMLCLLQNRMLMAMFASKWHLRRIWTKTLREKMHGSKMTFKQLKCHLRLPISKIYE